MPITSKRVVVNRPLAHQFDIKLEYTFNDGEKRTVSCRSPLVTDADMYLESKEQNVLESKIFSDLDDAIAANSDTPTEDMDQTKLYKAWMIKGYRSDDPVKSYKYLSKVAQKVLALGLTAQQLADAFNEEVETVNLVIAKWLYLKANKDAILAYQVVKENM